MAVSIVFNAINVNALDTNATVAVGQNAQSSWDSHAKNNFGVGMFFGISFTPLNFNYVVDPDVVDSPITDPDVKPSATVQTL